MTESIKLMYNKLQQRKFESIILIRKIRLTQFVISNCQSFEKTTYQTLFFRFACEFTDKKTTTKTLKLAASSLDGLGISQVRDKKMLFYLKLRACGILVINDFFLVGTKF